MSVSQLSSLLPVPNLRQLSSYPDFSLNLLDCYASAEQRPSWLGLGSLRERGFSSPERSLPHQLLHAVRVAHLLTAYLLGRSGAWIRLVFDIL